MAHRSGLGVDWRNDGAGHRGAGIEKWIHFFQAAFRCERARKRHGGNGSTFFDSFEAFRCERARKRHGDDEGVFFAPWRLCVRYFLVFEKEVHAKAPRRKGLDWGSIGEMTVQGTAVRESKNGFIFFRQRSVVNGHAKGMGMMKVSSLRLGAFA